MALVRRSAALLASSLPGADSNALAAVRIRRCRRRRLTALVTRQGRTYDVECCRPDGLVLPLGDLQSATPICNACSAPGTFRDDED